jgi:hypothetical protein
MDLVDRTQLRAIDAGVKARRPFTVDIRLRGAAGDMRHVQAEAEPGTTPRPAGDASWPDLRPDRRPASTLEMERLPANPLTGCPMQ